MLSRRETLFSCCKQMKTQHEYKLFNEQDSMFASSRLLSKADENVFQSVVSKKRMNDPPVHVTQESTTLVMTDVRFPVG
jgi:hypothetical protein